MARQVASAMTKEAANIGAPTGTAQAPTVPARVDWMIVLPRRSASATRESS